MSEQPGTALDLVERLKRKAPGYLDLFTAETDVDFEKAFDGLLEQAISKLEMNKKNFNSLDEVGLSAALSLALSVPGLTVSQESHSNGHVDLTIEADHCTPMRKKLGEAKIYRGPVYHIQGIEQLLGRYTTGREGHGLLIVYVKKANITGLVKNLRENLDDCLPFNQKGATTDHLLKWSFNSIHGHSCGDDLQVGHIGCNLYVE